MRRKEIIAILLLTAITGLWTAGFSCRRPQSLTDLLPKGIADSIYLSPENPWSAEKAELGHYLFYDRRISVNNTKSCAGCHAPQFSFTDGYRRSAGALGDMLQRNAPALINLIFNPYLTAADSTLHFPEQQINNPLFHNNPVELGWSQNENTILERIQKDSFYSIQFRKLFPKESQPVNTQNIQACISDFIKTIIALQSPYDLYMREQDSTGFSASARRGMILFSSPTLACNRCHGGINFNRPGITGPDGKPIFYFNTGLYNIGDSGAYPAYDRGLLETTGRPADMGKYKVPTLRNLIFTAPYFHDGSANTLDEVLDIYARGGRLTQSGEWKGDGRNNPHKAPLINGFQLNSQQRTDLIQFLLSLTDSSVIGNKALTNPFIHDETRDRENH